MLKFAHASSGLSCFADRKISFTSPPHKILPTLQSNAPSVPKPTHPEQTLEAHPVTQLTGLGYARVVIRDEVCS